MSHQLIDQPVIDNLLYCLDYVFRDLKGHKGETESQDLKDQLWVTKHRFIHYYKIPHKCPNFIISHFLVICIWNLG